MKQKILSYLELPCDRCGSKRTETTPKSEEIQNSFGSSSIEVTLITCTNLDCQKEADSKRAKELVLINERKEEREERARERQANIAKTIAKKKEFKFGQAPKQT